MARVVTKNWSNLNDMGEKDDDDDDIVDDHHDNDDENAGLCG